MAGGWCSAQQIKNYMIANGNHTKMSPKDDGLLPVSVTNWPSGLPDKLQLEITKINKNNSHFSIDKRNPVCYTQLVNKNCSQKEIRNKK